MPALERVEVVEPDREREAESVGDLGAEHALALLAPSAARTRPRAGSSSPSRIPLSGVISSYDQARFGASVWMPSVRRSHCPPQGPGRNVGRVRNGPPGERRGASRAAPRRQRARPAGLAQVDERSSAARAPACGGRGAASRRRAAAARCRLAPGCLAEVRRLAPPHRSEADASAGPRTRAGRAGRARRRGRRRASRPVVARRWRQLVEEIGERPRRGGGRRPDRPGAPRRPSAARSRSRRAAWRRMSTTSASSSCARTRPEPASRRSHGERGGPVDGDDARAASHAVAGERLVADLDLAARDRIAGLRVVAHRDAEVERQRRAPGELAAAERRAGRRLVVLGEAGARDELEREPAKLVGLGREARSARGRGSGTS